MLTTAKDDEQPLARLLVEADDALAQPGDRFDQIVALGGERGVLGLDLAQFFLGAQIDGAEPLAVAAQPFELGLDRGDVRQHGVRLDAGEARDRIGLDLEHLVDLVGDVGESALGAFDALLGAGGLLAGRAERFERCADRAVAGAERVLGLGKTIGGGAAGGFGGLDLADQQAALLLEDRRRVGQRRALLLGLGAAGVERGDLGDGAVFAVAPGLPVGADGGEPAVGELGLARQRLRLGAHLGELRALAFDLGADVGELALQVGGRWQFGERRFRQRPGWRWASSRPAISRVLASVRAEMRAVLRAISRSAMAWSSRALSASRCAVRQCSRAAASAAPAAVRSDCAASAALRLSSSVGARG